MNQQQMNQRGQQHAASGGKLTPFELQALDAELFAACAGLDKFAGAKFYNEMRGAFNTGWQQAHARQVSQEVAA